MRKISLMIIFSLMAIPCIAAPESKNEGKKIVKWVDSKGVTQYGDKLPASEAGRSNAEMNTQGMVIKRNVITNKSADLQDQQKLEQERKDKILLASYTNAEEIDLAKERNLQLDKAALQALSQQKINVTNRIANTTKMAEGIKARKKPVPAHLTDELKLSKSEIANIDKQMTQRKSNMATTNARYTEEKTRFLALKQSTTQVAPEDSASDASSPAVSTTVNPVKANNMATITTQP
jgi:hypothetical protein